MYYITRVLKIQKYVLESRIVGSVIANIAISIVAINFKFCPFFQKYLRFMVKKKLKCALKMLEKYSLHPCPKALTESHGVPTASMRGCYEVFQQGQILLIRLE